MSGHGRDGIFRYLAARFGRFEVGNDHVDATRAFACPGKSGLLLNQFVLIGEANAIELACEIGVA